jgi:uncharacterized repeat protein (TIGR01451 family)
VLTVVLNTLEKSMRVTCCFIQTIIRTRDNSERGAPRSFERKRWLHTYLRHECFAPKMRKHLDSTRHLLKKLRTFSMFVVAMCTCTQVTAQDNNDVETELIAEVRVEITSGPHKGVARFVPAAVLSQGEVVYYTVRIKNPTSEYLRDVSVTQRIPVNTVYVPDSASGPGAEVLFSVDGGATFAAEEALNSIGEDGVAHRASEDEYTHIQWRMQNALAPGAVALARFRAVFQ